MRRILLPNEEAEHAGEIDMYLTAAPDAAAVFVAQRPDGSLGGFVEVATRPWADGCASMPVAYIEAWYVDPDLRMHGVGRALFAAAERWAMDAGFTEIGSDAETHNSASIAAHKALGYEEVLRIVCFRRTLERRAEGG